MFQQNIVHFGTQIVGTFLPKAGQMGGQGRSMSGTNDVLRLCRYYIHDSRLRQLRPVYPELEHLSGASVHWDRAVGTVPLQHPASREGGNGEESKTVKWFDTWTQSQTHFIETCETWKNIRCISWFILFNTDSNDFGGTMTICMVTLRKVSMVGSKPFDHLTSIKIDRSSFWSFWDICLCKPSLGAAKKVFV